MNQYNFHLEILDEPISLLTYSKNKYDEIMFNIMKSVLFYSEIKFFSLTCSEDEISLFIETKYKPKLEEIKDENYIVIRIYDFSDGIDNIGIVSKLSTILSSNNVPILYINSFNNNYILIKKNKIEYVKETLIKEGFII